LKGLLIRSKFAAKTNHESAQGGQAKCSCADTVGDTTCLAYFEMFEWQFLSVFAANNVNTA
jgi:hypothetical protein